MRWIIAILIATPLFCTAQKRGAVWVFGDSALVDFSDTANIQTGASSIHSRGSCASISDSTGNLLFYSGYDLDTWNLLNPPDKNGEVWNKLHQTMQGGDSIFMMAWYREVVIIPYPGTSDKYFVISILVNGVNLSGIFYAVIDLSANGGLGAVIQKNVQLPHYYNIVDCLTAVKHGNGRDWWVLFRRWNSPQSAPNNEFHSYLVSPAGITNYTNQQIGSTQSSGFGNIAFNSDGSKFIYSNPHGLMEEYDFDRCTGVISNPKNIFPEQTSPPYTRKFWGGAYSPSDSLFYSTTFPLAQSDTSRLLQFKLFNPNIGASADTILQTEFIKSMGSVKKALNGKIYLHTNYFQNFPYADTVYNVINQNLSIINKPDFIGVSCNLTQFNFYLGGKRTYVGENNNPDYHLGPKIGSGCDTLTALNEHSQNIVISSLWPNPSNGEFTVNYFLPNGKRGVLEVFGSTGQKVYQMDLPNHTYRQDVDIKTFPSGIYVLRIQSGDKSLIKKFVKL